MLKERRAFVWLYGYDLIEIRIRDKYWKYFICDEKYLTRGLYKAESTNSAISHLFKDHNIRESNKRKGYAEGENDSEDDSLMSGIVTPSSAAGIVYDQLVLGANKLAKSIVTKSLYKQFKDALILWIIAIQIALSVIENQ